MVINCPMLSDVPIPRSPARAAHGSPPPATPHSASAAPRRRATQTRHPLCRPCADVAFRETQTPLSFLTTCSVTECFRERLAWRARHQSPQPASCTRLRPKELQSEGTVTLQEMDTNDDCPL